MFIKNLAALIAAVSLLFTVSTDAALSLSEGQVPLRTKTIRLHPEDGAQGVASLKFRVSEIQSGDALGTVTVRHEGTAKPSTLSLYQGSRLLSSRSVSQSQIAFSDLDFELPATDMEFVIKADYPVSSPGGIAWSRLELVEIRTSAGLTTPSQAFFGPAHRLVASAIADWTLASQPTSQVVSDENGRTVSVIATFTFNVAAIGGDISVPKNGDISIFAAKSKFETVNCSSVAVSTVPNHPIADGASAVVIVTASLAARDIPGSGLYRFSVRSISWTSAAGKIPQTWGLEGFVTEHSNLIVLVPQPVHSKFSARNPSHDGTCFTIEVVSIPGSFQIQGSSDLVTWKPVVCEKEYFAAESDGSAVCQVRISKSVLPSLSLDSQRCFFRAVLNQ